MSRAAHVLTTFRQYDDAVAVQRQFEYAAALIAGGATCWNLWAGYWANEGVQ